MKTLTPPPTKARQARAALDFYDRLRWSRHQNLQIIVEEFKSSVLVQYNQSCTPEEADSEGCRPEVTQGFIIAKNMHRLPEIAGLAFFCSVMAEHPEIKRVDAIMRAAAEEEKLQAAFDVAQQERLAAAAAKLYAAQQAAQEAAANDPAVAKAAEELAALSKL